MRCRISLRRAMPSGHDVSRLLLSGCSSPPPPRTLVTEITDLSLSSPPASASPETPKQKAIAQTSSASRSLLLADGDIQVIFDFTVLSL
jgi:hypothetical protein